MSKSLNLHETTEQLLAFFPFHSRSHTPTSIPIPILTSNFHQPQARFARTTRPIDPHLR